MSHDEHRTADSGSGAGSVVGTEAEVGDRIRADTTTSTTSVSNCNDPDDADDSTIMDAHMDASAAGTARIVREYR